MASHSEDFFAVRNRLRARYTAPAAPAAPTHGEILDDGGFLTEIAGRVILTAPAHTFTEADDLPKELAERWSSRADSGSRFNLWLQGRFVEAEKANRNGAYWSTEDLQFGEMSVRNGPLNWLHEEKTVIGTIADNALVMPENTERAELTPGPRPYIAAASAVWRWVHPDKVKAIEAASDAGRLYYSMECIAREMSCQSDQTHVGCGKSFDYVTAMTNPRATCEHIAAKSSARRMVDPSFLGGAVIVPPVQPGWAGASVEVIRSAASLAEQTEQAMGDMRASEWEQLMASVVRYATS